MKTTEYIAKRIDRLPKGFVFTCSSFDIDVDRREAVVKALNRMAASEKIVKLSKGKFYKPETSLYGNLQPGLYQMVKDLLVENGKQVGYLTGYSLYNQLGLTTQVSNTIQIGRNQTRPAFKRGGYVISIVRQKNAISREFIPLLQILDAVRYIKKIPDTSNAEAAKRLLAIVSGLEEKELLALVRLALKYSPATRALLGAMLEESGNGEITAVLRNSLNPISIYKIPGIPDSLSSAGNWYIR